MLLKVYIYNWICIYIIIEFRRARYAFKSMYEVIYVKVTSLCDNKSLEGPTCKRTKTIPFSLSLVPFGTHLIP
jgi:hypothetical protein